MPLGALRLEGESDSRSWTLYLTAAEAARAGAFAIEFKNTVLVMPEVSRLRVTINGETLLTNPINSPTEFTRATAPLRPGLLRAGENSIRIEVFQRHRVDCTIKGTYELWTDIDPAATGFTFSGPTPGVTNLQELPAIGFDQRGITRIAVTAPGSARPEVQDRVMRLAQAIALRGRYAHPVVTVGEGAPGPAEAGTLRVVLARAEELRGILPSVPSDAAARPFAGFTAPGLLVVSGVTWPELDEAIALVGAAGSVGASGSPGGLGASLPTASWFAPDAPLIRGEEEISFAKAGIPTTEFSGRRLTTRLLFALPADFYASNQGEAVIALDGAIAQGVRPRSRIDVYVNGQISATAPIGTDRRNFDRFPIRVSMTHFKPGLNTLVMEAVLDTRADEICSPGTLSAGPPRLALFDSTVLRIPRFARIGRRPDLAALALAGPVPAGDEPLSLVLLRPSMEVQSAAATLMARLAVQSGRAVPLRTRNFAEAGTGPALFVGAASDAPTELLQRLDLSANLQRGWAAALAAAAPEPQAAQPSQGAQTPPRPSDLPAVPTAASNDEIRSRWRNGSGGAGLWGSFSFAAVEEWAGRMVQNARTALTPRLEGPGTYEPPGGTRWLMAEGSDPARTASWTLVTGPTEAALRDGMAQAAKPPVWAQVAGRVAVLQSQGDAIGVEKAVSFDFMPTQPLNPANLRLVAANWLAANMAPYAILIILSCIGLGLTTYAFVGQAGRR